MPILQTVCMRKRIAALVFAIAILNAPQLSAASIIGNFIGGTQLGPSVGGGNIVDIFNAAASTWEAAIADPVQLTIDYGWGPDPGGYHYLLEQGGTPNRETH